MARIGIAESKRNELTTLGERPAGARANEPLGLPAPFFPRYPEKLGDVEPDAKYLPRGENPYRTRVNVPMVARALRGWLYPYIGSRVKPGEFHPIVSYLFTEWKCNLDCHYCWAYNNTAKGMTETVARRSIDWLHDTGCRVLALMGGEVLLRPQFAHRVVDYAAHKGFFVYVPTNGRLRTPDVYPCDAVIPGTRLSWFIGDDNQYTCLRPSESEE